MDNEYRSPAEVWQVLSPTRQTESSGWVAGEPTEEAEVVSVEEAEILDAVLEFCDTRWVRGDRIKNTPQPARGIPTTVSHHLWTIGLKR